MYYFCSLFLLNVLKRKVLESSVTCAIISALQIKLFILTFGRKEEFKIEYVSETMSRQTFHFLQQQIENYR
jgi:hypothetical protein